MRHSILKSYSLKDWARSSEKWGDPHVILQSAAQSEEENDEKEAFLKNFGNNGYAIIEENDVKLLERSTSGNPHHIFLDFITINNGSRPFCGERLKNCYISFKRNGGFGIGSPGACFSE